MKFPIAALLCFLTPGALLAREARALLIGASTYPSLDERFWLKGPANDVDLVARYLASNPVLPFAPDNIVVLADGVDGGRAPTLAAIRAEFAALAVDHESWINDMLDGFDEDEAQHLLALLSASTEGGPRP